MEKSFKIYSNNLESLYIRVVKSKHSLVHEIGDNSIEIELSGEIDPNALAECAESLRQFLNCH
jgi:hypothetical protein